MFACQPFAPDLRHPGHAGCARPGATRIVDFMASRSGQSTLAVQHSAGSYLSRWNGAEFGRCGGFATQRRIRLENFRCRRSSRGRMRRADLESSCMLALPRYGIAKRGGGKLAGSWTVCHQSLGSGQETYADCPRRLLGRPRVCGSIEIEMGKSFRDQMIALDLGKADVIEVAPDQARHAVLGRPAHPEFGSRRMDGAGLQPRHPVRRRAEIAPGSGAQHRSSGHQ